MKNIRFETKNIIVKYLFYSNQISEYIYVIIIFIENTGKYNVITKICLIKGWKIQFKLLTGRSTTQQFFVKFKRNKHFFFGRRRNV